MPTIYKRKTKPKYSSEALKNAIELVRSGKEISAFEVSKQSKVPYATLTRWLEDKKPKRIGTGGIPILNESEEKIIIDGLDFYAKCGIPLRRDAVQDLVQSYLRTVNKKNKFTNDRPGADWCRSFEKRNIKMLFERKLEIITTKSGILSSTYKIYASLDQYERVISQNQLKSNPHRIFNLDEMVLNTRKGSNVQVNSPKEGKEIFTVLFCKSVSGVYLPPFTLYNGKRMKESWTKGGPNEAVYALSDFEWMGNKNFENWFNTVFVKFVNNYEKPVLLTYSGSNIHLTYDTIKSAIQNQIVIMYLPPSNSLAPQLIDVGVGQTVNEEWMKILKSWFRNNQNSPVTKADFPSLLKELWESIVPEYDFKGFKDSGLNIPNTKAKANEVLTSSNHCLGEEHKGMTTIATSAPISSPGILLGEKDDESEVESPQASRNIKEDQEQNTKKKARHEETVIQSLQASKNVKEDQEQNTKKKARREETVIQSLQEEQSRNTVSDEVLTSSNCFEDVLSDITTTANSAPITHPETPSGENNDLPVAVSQQLSKDVDSDLMQNIKKKARLEETVMLSLNEEQTREDLAHEEVTSSNCFEEDLSDVTDIVTSSPIASPEPSLRMENNEFQDLDSRFDALLKQNVQKEQMKNTKAHEVLTSSNNCNEDVQSSISATVTSTSLESSGTEFNIRNDPLQTVSMQPSSDVTTAMEQNRKRKARFEEIMIQSLLEEQTTQKETSVTKLCSNERNTIETAK